MTASNTITKREMWGAFFAGLITVISAQWVNHSSLSNEVSKIDAKHTAEITTLRTEMNRINDRVFENFLRATKAQLEPINEKFNSTQQTLVKIKEQLHTTDQKLANINNQNTQLVDASKTLPLKDIETSIKSIQLTTKNTHKVFEDIKNSLTLQSISLERLENLNELQEKNFFVPPSGQLPKWIASINKYPDDIRISKLTEALTIYDMHLRFERSPQTPVNLDLIEQAARVQNSIAYLKTSPLVDNAQFLALERELNKLLVSVTAQRPKTIFPAP